MSADTHSHPNIPLWCDVCIMDENRVHTPFATRQGFVHLRLAVTQQRLRISPLYPPNVNRTKHCFRVPRLRQASVKLTPKQMCPLMLPSVAESDSILKLRKPNLTY